MPLIQKRIFPFSGLIFLWCFLFPNLSFAQQQKITYFRTYGWACEKDVANYYRVTNYDSNGMPTGFTYEYYINGDLKWKGKLLSDHPIDIADGVCVEYYHNGNPKEKCFCVNGKKEGNDSGFYYNGKVKWVMEMKNGLREGFHYTYYRDGKLESKTPFKNDMGEGEAIYYLESGKIYRRENYKNGRKNGKYQVLGEDGRIVEEENYVNDTIDGIQVEYDAKGVFQSKSEYKMGVVSGTKIQMFSDSKDTSYIAFYSNSGKYLGTRSYDLNGILQRVETVNDTNGKWSDISYFPNGQISAMRSGHYKQYENKEGRQYDYFENGKLAEVSCDDGDTNVYDTLWYENGKIKKTSFGRYEEKSETYFDSTGILIAQNIPDSLKLEIAKDNISCFYGLKNFSGQWTVRPRYTEIREIKNGYYLVNENEKWGVLDLFGKEIISPQYEYIDMMTDAELNDINEYDGYDGYDDENNLMNWDIYRGNKLVKFLVTKDHLYGLVNVENKIIIPLEYDVLDLGDRGRFRFKKGEYFGYGDTTGFISPIKYVNDVEFLEGNYIRFSVDSTDDYDFNYFDNNGNHQNGLMDYAGNVIIPPLYDEIFIKYDPNSIVWVSKNDKYGLYDIHGKKILDTLYTLDENQNQSYYVYVGNLRDTATVIKKGKKFSLVSNSGRFLTPFKYDSLIFCGANSLIFEEHNKYGLLGENFKPISKRRYSLLQVSHTNDSDYDDGSWEYTNLMIACCKGKYGVIDENDSVILPFVYDEGWFGEDNQIEMIRKDSLHKFDSYDSRVTEIIPELEIVDDQPIEEFCDGDDAYSEYNNYRQCGIVSPTGKIILDPNYEIDFVGPNLVIFKDHKEKTGVFIPGNKPVLLSKKFKDPIVKNSHSIYVTAESGKVGVVDASGKIIVDTIFYALDFYEEAVKAYWVKTTPVIILKPDSVMAKKYDQGWGLINTSGKYILKPVWQYPVYFEDTSAIVEGVDGFGVVGKSGSILLNPIYDEVICEKNKFYIIKKNDLYGFANSSGKVIVAPKWKKVSGFLGKVMFCYNETGTTELVDETGKVLAVGNQNSSMNWKLGLDSLVTFYKFHYVYERGGWASDDILSLNYVIPGYGMLNTATFQKEKRHALSNYLITLSATDYTDFDSEIEGDLSYMRREFYSSDGFIPNNYLRSSTPIFDYEVNLINTSQSGFSIVTCFSDCKNYYMGNCNRSTTFTTYEYCGDSICPVRLENIFDTTKNYKLLLTGLITKEMQSLTDPSIGCSEPETYMKQIGENFSLTDSSIVLYMPKGGQNSGYFNQYYYVQIEIQFADIMPILNKEWLLENSIGKKQK
jgi:antitoxin component YwqK of YwqJK toxin-antitoxin module